LAGEERPNTLLLACCFEGRSLQSVIREANLIDSRLTRWDKETGMLGSTLGLVSQRRGTKCAAPREARKPAAHHPLSPRSWQVIELVAQGLPNREISKRMGLAEGTVKQYLSRVFKKTGVCNRTQLALLFHADKLTDQ
jgi:DNA-binding NarL/FixJ family response regulator